MSEACAWPILTAKYQIIVLAFFLVQIQNEKRGAKKKKRKKKKEKKKKRKEKKRKRIKKIGNWVNL